MYAAEREESGTRFPGPSQSKLSLTNRCRARFDRALAGVQVVSSGSQVSIKVTPAVREKERGRSNVREGDQSDARGGIGRYWAPDVAKFSLR